MSVQGCAVMSARHYQIGDLLTVRIEHEDHQYEGVARVQSTRPLAGGTTRYGLLCVEDRCLDGSLKKGLQQMSMALQREQLRPRRSGK